MSTYTALPAELHSPEAGSGAPGRSKFHGKKMGRQQGTKWERATDETLSIMLYICLPKEIPLLGLHCTMMGQGKQADIE